jgi:glucose-6-phosphate isomerase
MSVIRPKPPEDPIAFDPGPLCAAIGLPAGAADPAAADLERSRDECLDMPLVHQPDRLLADYNGTASGRTRATSELYGVLQTARRIRDAVDRVIVLADADTTQAVRAVFSSCCHPFHNELSRGERGGRPRLSFAGLASDADWLQGIVDLVAPAGAARGDDLLDRWAIVLCPEPPGTAADVLVPLLLQSVGGDRLRLADRMVSITGDAGDPHPLTVPVGFGGCRGIFTPATLLPAALVGIDVVRLLQGAAAMNRRYREAAVGHNPVLQFVAASRQAARSLQAAPRLVSEETERLHDLVRWHARLGDASEGPRAAASRTSAAAIRLLAGEPRRDPRAAVPLGRPGDRPQDAADRLRRAAGPPPDPPAAAATIRLPRIDEHTVGQLVQMLLLATMLEERLPG